MSQTTTLILLPETSYLNPGNGAPYTVIGEGRAAAGYYLGNRDLQTVNTKVTNFTGNIIIQATLASSPTSDEWFTVHTMIANANASPNSEPQIASNASVYTNIEGNFVFMRAKIEDLSGGTLQFVKLSY